MAPHSSTLAWKIPWTEKPGRLQSMGLLRVWHDWATSLLLFTFMHWRRKWQPTRVLAWRIPGTEEPGGLPSMRSHRVGHDCSDLAAAAAVTKLWFSRYHFPWKNQAHYRKGSFQIRGRKYMKWAKNIFRSDQIRSVAQSCPTLCNPMNCSTPGLPVRHRLPEFTQTHVHRVSDAIQPSHPLSSPSPPALSLSQHQGLCKWVSSSYHCCC